MNDMHIMKFIGGYKPQDLKSNFYKEEGEIWVNSQCHVTALSSLEHTRLVPHLLMWYT
jgi:hypothetical protein